MANPVICCHLLGFKGIEAAALETNFSSVKSFPLLCSPDWPVFEVACMCYPLRNPFFLAK